MSTQQRRHLTSKHWGRIMAKAWRDPVFKQQIEEDPTKAVRQFISGDLKENPDDYIIFHMPAKPDDMTDADVSAVATGAKEMYGCTHLC